jgi:nucleoside-diphosphate-sugar epimerase
MAAHVIVGAGAVGTATARLLAERGEQVRMISRSGSGPEHPAIERIAADATDAERLTELCQDAEVLYNCVNPAYHRWLSDWPPIATALLTAAERSGAVLANASNLYPYGETDGPITAETPLGATHPKLKLREKIWQDALAAHRAGRVRAVEVRASDYLEANSIFAFILIEPISQGKTARVPADLDAPHTWTSITDVAATLVRAAEDESAHGRVWMVPSNPPTSIRQLAVRYAELNNYPAPKPAVMPYPMLWIGGLFNPMAKELRTTYYQWSKPFTMDSSETEKALGLSPVDLDTALAAIPAPAAAS